MSCIRRSGRFLGLIGLAVAATGWGDEFFTYKGEPLLQQPAAVISDPAGLGSITGRLRVASYNLEHFTDGVDDGPERTAEAAQAHAAGAAGLIDRMAPDLLVVQEIEGSNAVCALNARLARPFALSYVTRLGEMLKTEDKLNLAVLSHVPVLSTQEIDFGPLSGPGRPTRGLLRVTVDLGDHHRLLLYVMHLKSNFGNKPRNIAQREAALNILVNDAKAVMQQQPEFTWEMIAVGDTNVDPEQAQFADDTSFRPLANWVDLWRGRPLPERTTIPTRVGDPALEFPPAAFDRIFVSASLTNAPWTVGVPGVIQQGCNTNDSHALPGTQGHISDHFPVYVDLTR